MRIPHRPAALSLLFISAALLSGCYEIHGSEDPPPLPDGGRVDGRVLRPDAGPDAGRDGGFFFDGGPDAGDAGPDSAVVGVDAAPPLGRPPNPEGCRVEPPPFRDPVLEARWPDNPDMEHPSSVHVCSTAVSLDPFPADGLDDPVIGFISYATLRGEERGILRIWNPRTHETVSYPTDSTELGQMEATGSLAAGDLDGDGDAEFIGMGVFSGTFAVHHDGTLLWESPFPTVRDRGERRERTIGTAVSLVDLEGDGTVEVIAGRNVLEGATGERRFVGDSSNTTRGTNEFLGPIACAADLDGDGIQEVIAGRTAFRANGDVMWNQESVPDGFCAIADLVADNPGPEVALSSRGYLYVLSGADGAILYNRAIEGRGRFGVGGAPTVADFDGDGRPELGIAHGSAYGVYDLDCEGPNRPRGSGCVAEGLLWTQPTGDDSSSGTGSSVFDFNGDGRAEVVYNDQYFFRIYDGSTGTVLFEHRNSSRTRTENPIVVDADNDGEAEVIFSSNAEAFFIRDFWTDPGVEIWGDERGRWVGSRRIWNQHAYHITNVNEDGTITAGERPSWAEHNSYRQNLREGADVLVVPDLWGGRGRYECIAAGGRVRFEIDVANYGLERIGAGVVIGIYRGPPSAGERVGEVLTTRTLEGRGDTETVSFETVLTGEVTDYWAVLDDGEDGGFVHECREGNNEVLIWRPECP